MDKKAQGLSINVIIIVAISLIVLVVLIAIFTGRMGGFVKGVDTSSTCSNACSALGMEKGSSAQLAPPSGTGGCTSITANYRFLGGGKEKYGDLTGSEQCCCVPS